MFRQEERKSGFKKGIDSSEGRRCRNETSIKLRKDKKEEGLAKRRVMNVSIIAPPPDQKSTTNSAIPKAVCTKLYTVSDIPALTARLRQSNINDTTMLEVARGFRKILSVESNPPVNEVLRSGILPAFVHMLTLNDKPVVQFEAAWALTNIASTEMTNEVADAGAIPLLVNILASPSAEIREQSAWCLGNIAGDSTSLRDAVLASGAIQPLIRNIMSSGRASLVSNSVWALSNFCRGKPAPSLSHIMPAIPALASVLVQVNDEAKVDALWAFSYISEGNDDRIKAVIDSNIVPTLVRCLNSDLSNIVTPALRTVGNLVSGNDEHTQAVLDAGLIEKMKVLLHSSKRTIRKEACWVLSNVAAGTQKQIGQVFKGGICVVVELATNAEWEVRKEAVWVISNIATGGTSEHVMSVVECGAIDALCNVLGVNDVKMLVIVLEALNSILEVGRQHNKDYVSFVDECGGLVAIECLQEHNSEEVYNHAHKIIENYFGVDDAEMEDENLAPEVHGDTFSFGIIHKELDISIEDDPALGRVYNFAAI